MPRLSEGNPEGNTVLALSQTKMVPTFPSPLVFCDLFEVQSGEPNGSKMFKVHLFGLELSKLSYAGDRKLGCLGGLRLGCHGLRPLYPSSASAISETRSS